ncbi:hypothetical protein OC834_004845 [Tilletia horrida]|uniref:RPA43 OB domain-containing protein n=1 Tax=Tilletia horrida TaxID=155126 RepID=A0AAN6G5B2_9BASI|nr:hypothetical protein OC842_006903 [Tilletia horrida]KAK0526323.1 hypothetical protein OC834_004845 [Tilletia horrida]KAK0558904.1 hypothetical protein OC844_004792 [Tilletia horrida]
MEAGAVMSMSSSRSTPSKASGKKRKREDGAGAAAATPTKSTTAAAAAASSSAPGTPNGDDAAAKRLAKQARKEKKAASKSGAEHANGAKENGKKKSKSRSSLLAPGQPVAAAALVDAPPESAYRVVYPTLNMPIAPVWWKQPLGAVRELFDAMVMRHVPQLNGILISHTEHTFLKSTAELRADSAFATAPVKVKCVVWSPSIGMRLEGQIVYSNTDVVSLLLNGTFNAAIPAAHLPPNQYEFVHHQYSADENGYGEGDDEIGAQSPGFWRNKRDGTQLGGSSGRITFTCFGITVANDLLFLRGSLLDDPLSAISNGTDPSASPSQAVDARKLQTLFPNLNLDFSSKEGLESGARRSAVRGANGQAGASQGTKGDEGEGETAVRRRVRWFDQEDDGEDGDEGGVGDAGAEDSDDGAQLAFGQATSSSSAPVSSDAEESEAENGDEDDEDDDDDDDDEDEDDEDDDEHDNEELPDISMASTTSVSTSGDISMADVTISASEASPSKKAKSKTSPSKSKSKSKSSTSKSTKSPAGEKDNSPAARQQRKAHREEVRRKKKEKKERRVEREKRKADKAAKKAAKAAKHAKVKKEALGAGA